MSLDKKSLKERLLSQYAEELDEMLDQVKDDQSLHLTEIEEMALKLRQEVGQDVTESLVDHESSKQAVDEIPNWHFLTGQAEELELVWTAYHIEVVPSEEDISHTPGVYIIDPQGQLRWYISTPFVTPGTPAPSRPLYQSWSRIACK